MEIFLRLVNDVYVSVSTLSYYTEVSVIERYLNICNNLKEELNKLEKTLKKKYIFNSLMFTLSTIQIFVLALICQNMKIENLVLQLIVPVGFCMSILNKTLEFLVSDVNKAKSEILETKNKIDVMEKLLNNLLILKEKLEEELVQ